MPTRKKLRKIIFLDIDGVLNSRKFFNNLDSTFAQSNSEDNLDPDCIKRLNHILAVTGAEVVITDRWRLSKSQDEIQNILEKKGFTGKIIGTTIDLSHIPLTKSKARYSSVRDQEIKAYVKENKEFNIRFVILDDEVVHPRLQMQVQTSFKKGLTNSDANEVIELLKPLPVRSFYPKVSPDEIENPKQIYRKTRFPRIEEDRVKI